MHIMFRGAAAQRRSGWLHWGWLVAWLALLWTAPARALVLSGHPAVVDCWPELSVLPDPAEALQVEQVLGRLDRFRAPQAPYANLGTPEGAVWLRVPLMLSDTQEDRRVLVLDFALLDRGDVYLASGGDVLRHEALVLDQPYSLRPYPSRAHAVSFVLERGRAYELLLRVQSMPMVVPLRLLTPTAFHAEEAREQVLQGALAGLGLCLVLYSLAQWLVLRERMFLDYSLYVFSVTVFSLVYFGVAQQHLWPEQPWLLKHAASVSLCACMIGMAWFVVRVLQVPRWGPRLARAFDAVWMSSALVMLAFALDVIEDRFAATLESLLGPVLMLLAAYAAVARLRSGDRAAPFMLIGWGVYVVGVIVFTLMFQGYLPATYATQHSLQFATLGEMSMWMVVLGVRVQEVRDAAQRTRIERDRLHSLAYTDALTGLANRRGLDELLHVALPHAAPDRLIAVYLLDLDGFKAVNDRLGHDAGDRLLVQLGQRLKTLLRSRDTVVRLGGDEFVVVACDLSSESEAHRLGQKVLDGLRAPFELPGHPACQVGATIGYAVAPLDGNNADTLLKSADNAMYASKRAGHQRLARAAAAGCSTF